MTKNELFKFIENYIKPLGFQKKESSWYKENPETVTIFALDKSRWGDIYYIYLCVVFKGLTEEKRLKFYKSHSQLRAESIGENTEEYLNLEENIDENIREDRIKQLLDKSISILMKMETERGFKELLKEFNPRLFMLNSKAQEYLGIKVE